MKETPVRSMEADKSSKIELQQISKRFGAIVALHPTDLSFEEGQTAVSRPRKS